MKKQIENWLQKLSQDNIDDNGIVALYFGIYETEAGYCLYLTGSKEYDADDDDWACSVDFEPKGNYLSIDSTMDWEQFLNTVSVIIEECVNELLISRPKLFSNKIIAVGFDDGQIIRIK